MVYDDDADVADIDAVLEATRTDSAVLAGMADFAVRYGRSGQGTTAANSLTTPAVPVVPRPRPHHRRDAIATRRILVTPDTAADFDRLPDLDLLIMSR
jgi:hypothetical protein